MPLLVYIQDSYISFSWVQVDICATFNDIPFMCFWEIAMTRMASDASKIQSGLYFNPSWYLW